MDVYRDPRIDLMQLKQRIHWDALYRSVQQYTSSLMTGSEQLAATNRADAHDRIDLIMDLISDDIRQLKQGRPR